jgi:GNAT superfamily N-acetyltransferase
VDSFLTLLLLEKISRFILETSASTHAKMPNTIKKAQQHILQGPAPASEGGAWVVRPNLNETCELAAKAFAGGEPGSAWITNHITWPPDDDETIKFDVFRFFMAFLIFEDARKGGLSLCFVEDKHDHHDGQRQLVSVASVIEHDTEYEKNKWFPWLRNKFHETVTTLRLLVTYGTPKFFATNKDDVAIIEQKIKYLSVRKTPVWHQQYGPQPGKHWYVHVVAVHPDRQGQGLGTQLMKRLHQAADEQGLACYLECVGDKNRSFYEKVGYKLVAQKVVVDPTSTTTSSKTADDHPSSPSAEPLTMYLMTRPCSTDIAEQV